jgi:hypothetical protein
MPDAILDGLASGTMRIQLKRESMHKVKAEKYKPT